MRTSDSASVALGSASVTSVLNPGRDGRRRARPRQAWSGGAPHPFRRFAGTSLQFTGRMQGRLWFTDLGGGCGDLSIGPRTPVRYSKALSEPLTHAEQEAVLAAEQAGLCRLEDHHKDTKSHQGPRSSDLVNLRDPLCLGGVPRSEGGE